MQPKSKVRKHLELSTHSLTKTLHYNMKKVLLRRWDWTPLAPQDT